jgi:hypothetical protein
MSGITGFARDFIKSYFPDNYFKTEFITTTSASSLESLTNDDDLPFNRYPLLSISPAYLPNYDDTFAGPMPYWRRGLVPLSRYSSERYGNRRIFYNDIDDIIIAVTPSRLKFSFEYKIKVQSHLIKIDVTHMLRRVFNENDKFFANNVILEAQVPNTIIKAISAIKGYDLEDQEDIKSFYKYLQQFSKGNIHEKTDLASGRKIFSYIYGANILIAVDNPAESDGKSVEKIGMSDAEGVVELTLTMELWIPDNYILECKTLPTGDYNAGLDETKVTIEHFVKLRPPQVKNDKVMIEFQKFITDVNVKVDISSLFEKPTLDFIDSRLKSGDKKLIEEIFDIDVYRDEKLMIYDRDYKFNWKTKEIEMILPLFNYTYNVAIYADQNRLLKYMDTKKEVVKRSTFKNTNNKTKEGNI